MSGDHSKHSLMFVENCYSMMSAHHLEPGKNMKNYVKENLGKLSIKVY